MNWHRLYSYWQESDDRRYWNGYCVQWKQGYKEYRNNVSWRKCVIDDYGNLVGV